MNYIFEVKHPVKGWTPVLNYSFCLLADGIKHAARYFAHYASQLKEKKFSCGKDYALFLVETPKFPKGVVYRVRKKRYKELCFPDVKTISVYF